MVARTPCARRRARVRRLLIRRLLTRSERAVVPRMPWPAPLVAGAAVVAPKPGTVCTIVVVAPGCWGCGCVGCGCGCGCGCGWACGGGPALDTRPESATARAGAFAELLVTVSVASCVPTDVPVKPTTTSHDVCGARVV